MKRGKRSVRGGMLLRLLAILYLPYLMFSMYRNYISGEAGVSLVLFIALMAVMGIAEIAIAVSAVRLWLGIARKRKKKTRPAPVSRCARESSRRSANTRAEV